MLSYKLYKQYHKFTEDTLGEGELGAKSETLPKKGSLKSSYILCATIEGDFIHFIYSSCTYFDVF